MEFIDRHSVKRAVETLRCFPLNKKFYEDAKLKGLKADEVFLLTGDYRVQDAQWFKTKNSLESAFSWLIKVGILRREVDGQGLTCSVRLTPLGRSLIEKNPNLPSQNAGPFEKTRIWLQRKKHF